MANSPTHLRHQKRDLRRLMETRRAKAQAQAPLAALALRDIFLKNVSLPPKSIVSGYSARGSEIDPEPLMTVLQAEGHILALPVVIGKGLPLLFRQHTSDAALIPGYAGILEPPSTAPILQPDVLLVPLLAFDKHLYRLGYGGGYYDRTLISLRQCKNVLAIGIGFVCQEVSKVPISPYDAKLDKIITEIQTF